ncbi:MAG TPA: Calx-beta domain-containing protein, partial [Pyrinomonadaceae bacterium]|nr:Calx-beta domain-containing protein [Pyrinomonadaceae bacterium]
VLQATLRSGIVFSLLLLVLAGARVINGQSMKGFQAPKKPISADQQVPESVKAAHGQAPLNKLYGHLQIDSAKVRRLPPLDPSEQKKAVSDKLLRIGIVRPLPIALDPLTDSAVYPVAEGDVHIAAVVSEGALFTRVHFKDMSLPPGARVFVYSMSKPDEYQGPYEGRGLSADGTFWTPPLSGDGVVIEFVTAPGTKTKVQPFQVSEVSHTFKEVFPENDQAGSCNLEVQSPWLNVAKSVGMLDFIAGGFEAICTGTLLNDTASDQIPYVLTANHCIGTQTEAQSVIVFWNYTSGDDPTGSTPSTFGANLLATGASSDFTLLRLTGTLPGGLFYSGWDANPLSSPPVSVTGIHHPNGSHRRISFGATNGSSASGLPGPPANFTGVTWNPGGGTTEEGSSGSGIWTGIPDGVNDVNDVRLVGTLNGGNASCATPNLSDFYARFSATYPNIAGFLNSCVTSLSPASQNFAAGGGPGSITVNSPVGCSWNAVSGASFITITSTSATTVNFSVAANSGWARSGTIVVGSQVFIVNQARSGSAVCTPTPIVIGQTVLTTLAATDCPLGDGTVLDPYTFNALAGQQVAVLMNGNVSMNGNFDTYLYLLNPDGSTLASNDDIDTQGGNLNSRIPVSGLITLPTSGTYTILANAFETPANGGTGTYSLQLTAPAPTIQLSQTSYSVNESSAFATITVTRFGDTSAPATVKYATSDATDVNFNCNPSAGSPPAGAASRKCDYHIAGGRLRFAAGENSKQIILSLVNDVYVEPAESLTITLSSPMAATLGTTSTATVTITDNDTPSQANPIDNTGFFVRMLYVDLLSREPEPSGLAGWVHRIDFCGQPGEPPPPCDRVTVGGDGFLRSAEFFDREFFVIRLYRTALGRILTYNDVGDLAFVSGFLSDADLELNKQEVVTDIMSRSEFGGMYNALNNTQYVDTLIQTAGVTLPGGVRDGWVNALNGSTKTRAQVFRELSERSEVSAKYLHEAQVVSCYYGFFTRNPDGAYFNFLDRLDRGEINLGDLANAFINAAEYRQRFGP